MSNAIARRLEAIQTKAAMRSSDVANVLIGGTLIGGAAAFASYIVA